MTDRSAEWDALRAAHLLPSERRPASSARGVHHVALLSTDVAATIAFYQGVLEMPLTELFENRDYPGSTHFFFDLGHGNQLAFFDFPGLDPTLPLFAFIFLVALGIDYNIFLMTRVREETVTHGTREGMLRGLAVTGTVITSAGIVLAGTFSALAVLPLVSLTEIGFTIAIGVLLDTFIVRTLLVPALVLEIGDRVWWPSALARATGARGPGQQAPARPGD